MNDLFEDLINYQKKKLLALAKEIIPSITEEDLLQPFDFEKLENSPSFRYEEGILHGLMSARAAVFANIG